MNLAKLLASNAANQHRIPTSVHSHTANNHLDELMQMEGVPEPRRKQIILNNLSHIVLNPTPILVRKNNLINDLREKMNDKHNAQKAYFNDTPRNVG